MADDPIVIEVLDPPALAFVDEPLPLRLVVRCPEGGPPTVLRSVRPLRDAAADLDADLFERDTPLGPGEVYRCTVVARFRRAGRYEDPPFVIIAGVDDAGRAVRVPTPPIRVVPSLGGEIRARAESICTYDGATKVDVTLAHAGSTRFDDFRFTVGPLEAVRAGVSDQCRPAFVRGEEIKFTTVVGADALALELNAQVGGEPIGPISVRLPVPPVREAEAVLPFRFLEPKKLTQADVRVTTLDEARAAIRPAGGLFVVTGGGDKYRVEITPAHPQAQGVKLRGASGLVEVVEAPSDAGTWAFQMVVVSNAVFTTTAALHYDVVTPDGPQQGELTLSIRPKNGRLWVVAATAGAAVTVKGVAAVVPAVLSPGDWLDAAQDAAMKVTTVRDLVQLLSIPLIRVGLWVVDRVFRPFQDD